MRSDALGGAEKAKDQNEEDEGYRRRGQCSVHWET